MFFVPFYTEFRLRTIRQDIENLDSGRLVQLQVEQIEKEKKDLAQKLTGVSKRIDHLERAFRKEEIPLLKQDYERQQTRDRSAHESAQTQRAETLRKQHAEDLEIKERLVKIMPDYEAFRIQIEENGRAAFEAHVAEQRARLEEHKAKRREEYRLAREAEAARRIEQEAEEAAMREENESTLSFLHFRSFADCVFSQNNKLSRTKRKLRRLRTKPKPTREHSSNRKKPPRISSRKEPPEKPNELPILLESPLDKHERTKRWLDELPEGYDRPSLLELFLDPLDTELPPRRTVPRPNDDPSDSLREPSPPRLPNPSERLTFLVHENRSELSPSNRRKLPSPPSPRPSRWDGESEKRRPRLLLPLEDLPRPLLRLRLCSLPLVRLESLLPALGLLDELPRVPIVRSVISLRCTVTDRPYL